MAYDSDIRRTNQQIGQGKSQWGVAMQSLSRSRTWLLGFPLRISLRTLMLLVLIVGGGLGWYSIRKQREARRQWVVSTIEAIGASLDYDGIGISRILWFSDSANPTTLSQRPLTSSEIDALGSCHRLREIMMDAGVMTDDGLAALSHDKLLERIYCLKPKITDAGVKRLANLTSLKRLELLPVRELTDEMLAHLAGLTGLEDISLSGASITGSGLVNLIGLKNLHSLSLSNTGLDDAGLANLGRLISLESLYIHRGAYTDAGIASLSSLTGLTELYMGSDRCTDACLANLSGLKKLQNLYVEGPKVTDVWLDRMAAMKSLRLVIVCRSQVSDEAIARLHRSLPDVQIQLSGRPK
jgi:hypothetical protein